MSIIHDWRQSTTCNVQTVGVNCPAVQWNSLVLGELPESVIRTICMIWLIKCQYWKRKTGIKRSEVMICLNDQATIAWLTPTRGVYQVTFSAYEFYWGLKKVHHMQSPNRKSQLSCSAMITTTNLLGGCDIRCSFFVCCQNFKNDIPN